MNKTYRVESPKDFEELIGDILNVSREGSLVITLSGDLGAGKTTFTQQLGEVLGVKEVITSPTFTIIKQYLLPDADKYDQLVHIDAYRIEDENEVVPLQLEAVLNDPRNIICIEWPEQIKSIIPEDSIQLSITIASDEVRMVEVSGL